MAESAQVPLWKEFNSQRLVSKLIHDSPQLRVALFCLEPGQHLAPHTSASEVLFYIVEGQGKVKIGEEEVSANPGSLAFCPPHLPHGLSASQRLVALAIISPRPD